MATQKETGAVERLLAKCVQAAFDAGRAKKKERTFQVFATVHEETEKGSAGYAAALAVAKAAAQRLRTEQSCTVEIVEGEDRPVGCDQRSFTTTYYVRLDVSF